MLSNLLLLISQKVSSLKNQTFVKNFTFLFIDRAVQLLGQVFNIFFLTKFLGPSNFGILMYSLSIYGFILTVSSFGMDRVLVVELAAKKDDSSRANVLLTGLLIKLITSLVIIGIISFCRPVMHQMLSVEVLPVLAFLSWNLLFTLWQIVDGFNQATGKFNNSVKARVISVLCIIFVKALLIWYKASFMYVVAAFVIEQALCLFLCLLFSSDFIKQLKSVKLTEFKFQKQMLSSGLFVLISTVCIILYMRTSQVIIENKFSKVYLGLFSLVIYIIEMPVSLASVLSTLFTPKISVLYANEHNNLTKQLGRILLFFICVSVFSCFLLALVAALLQLILGAAYTGFYGIMLRALPSIPLIFIGYYSYMVIMSCKKFKQYLLNTAIGAIGALSYLFLTKNYYITDNAVYLYVLSQFIANFFVPIILQPELRTSLKQSIQSIMRGEVVAELKLLNALFRNSNSL